MDRQVFIEDGGLQGQTFEIGRADDGSLTTTLQMFAEPAGIRLDDGCRLVSKEVHDWSPECCGTNTTSLAYPRLFDGGQWSIVPDLTWSVQ